MKKLVSLLLCLLLTVSLFAAGHAEEPAGLWENALYTEETELGEGANTVDFTVTVEDVSVRFLIHTDRDTVGEALQDNALIDGDEGPYGLYVKVVNGITADYDIDQTYWMFTVNGEMAMTGCDMTAIEEGALYGFVYAK